MLASSDAAGNYHVGEEIVPMINIIELICSDNWEASWYEALGIRIAEYLDWELLDEHNGRFLRPLTVETNERIRKP